MNARFLQLHTLTGYSATLLNRDDVGGQSACRSAAMIAFASRRSALNGTGGRRPASGRCRNWAVANPPGRDVCSAR